MNNKKSAFTLVELVVVIVILSILGTIAFISIQDYSKGSRNSVRITDLGIIKQSLGIFKINSGKYPIPDDVLEVSFSGGLLWYQGSFGNTAFTNLGNLSNIPLDPLYDNRYDYSLLNNKNKYQIGTILEGGGLFGSNNVIHTEVNAVGDGDNNAYITGDFGLFDIKSKHNGNCKMITTPSMFIPNLGNTGALLIEEEYNFVYDESDNITPNYIPKLQNTGSGTTFEIGEVLSSCSINTLDELNLYISKLSLAYQQLVGVEEFKDLIFNFSDIHFKLGAIADLKSNGILVHNDVILAAQDPSSGNIYSDTFTGLNNTNIVGGYSNDSLGTWSKTGALVNSSYIIIGNQLIKNDNNTGIIRPIPAFPFNSVDRSILFNIVDLAGGSVTLYSHYVDPNNYYAIEFSSTGIIIDHLISGISQLDSTTIITGIANDSNIEVNVGLGKTTININNVEKYTLTGLSFVGNPALKMSQNTKIDNFTLIYK